MEKDANLEIQKKLEYLKLDLDHIPSEITDYEALNFSVSRLANDKDHRVFRFVPIDQIDILFTPCLRTDPLKEKYSKAVPLYKYILPADKDEDVERYTTFLKMLRNVSIPEIENITSLQKEMEKKEPFKVKYNKDHMWQIYYDETSDRYFMLVCLKEETYAEFFYLLKVKLEHLENAHRAVPRIYVPINAMAYSEAFLDREEIADLSNYLWLFTKDWPLIFEVYNKSNVLSVQVVGETFVYDNVKSSYKVILKNKEDAKKFYRLLKALFIMQTEIKDYYNFKTKIDSNNGIEFYYNNTRITYEYLTDFVKEEVKNAENLIENQNEEIEDVEKKLDDLKAAIKIKEDEYLIKQKEISMYLEYKKTFFGKVKYFFKSPSKASNKKLKKDKKSLYDEEIPEDLENAVNEKPSNTISIKDSFQEKDLYTIEDLVTIHGLYEKSCKNLRNLNQDIKAQQLKFENLVSKVNNATLYIEEIDKHRKSIFDFWKFSNKDEKLSLEMGSENPDEENKASLKKSFNLETDLDDLGMRVDNFQRKKLSKDEQDALFIAHTDVLPLLNMTRSNNLNQALIEKKLIQLKQEYVDKKLQIDDDTYDIFGGANDDTKVRFIKSKSHRENEKNKYKILNINKKIDQFDFAERLQILNNYLEGIVAKGKAEYDFSLYKVSQINEKVLEDGFDVYDLDVENALQNFDDDGEGALNLIKLNIKENMPLIYYTNIIFYDNTNDTLPLGMDLSTSVFIDGKKFNYNLVNKVKFRTNKYFTESNNLILPKTKDVLVYEYDVELK